jgi:hypothetical protein
MGSQRNLCKNQGAKMTFELLPILDVMLDFYQKPRDLGRFQSYLQLLQGDTKGEMTLPIGGFNPMAKPHVLEKLGALKNLDTEFIMAEIIQNWNEKQLKTPIFKLSLVLADDAKGGWTNHFTTDFDSKFKLNPYIVRHFCTLIFWTSEDFTEGGIRERILAAMFRTQYWLIQKQKPKTLRDHVEQEVFVAKSVFSESGSGNFDCQKLKKYYNENADSEDYALIFNFFYGDAASASVGFKTFGIEEEKAGFEFVRYL